LKRSRRRAKLQDEYKIPKAGKSISISRRILSNMLSLPTAPFAEHDVIRFVGDFCRRRKNVTLRSDRAGNILVRVKIGNRRIKRPVCITAHLDHPGFVSDRPLGKGRIRALWRGGVPPEYFADAKVQFNVNGQWIKGRVVSTKTRVMDDRERVDTAVIEVTGDVPAGSIGMWDFPDPVIRGDHIHARACDDLAGVAAMLCAIDQLVRERASCDAYFLFTRAEEVGFVGAIAACRLKTVPRNCFVVAMETSSERPNAKIGDGPILRVGDRASTFHHPATAYCHRIARELEQAGGGFRYQRKLMDGGTCESSAYCRLGYEATGICVALGNYHNVDAKHRRLAPEYISLGDFRDVVRWFVELARAPHAYDGRDEQLDSRLRQLESSYRKLLFASVTRPK